MDHNFHPVGIASLKPKRSAVIDRRVEMIGQLNDRWKRYLDSNDDMKLYELAAEYQAIGINDIAVRIKEHLREPV